MKKMTKKQLAMAVTITLALGFNFGFPTTGYTSAGTSTFENFANKVQLEAKADEFRTKEYNNSTGLEPLNAARAYALGYSGAGITLGEVDKPVYYNHQEIKGKVETYVYNSAFSDRSHGTHVAGIMVAAKDDTGMHGIAYNAKLEAAGVDKDFYETFNNFVSSNITANVINNSWGNGAYKSTLTSEEIANYILQNDNYRKVLPGLSKAIISDDKIIVCTAGNDGQTTSQVSLSGFGNINELSNNFCNVMASNENYVSAFSNLAGGDYKFTVVAPGSNIASLNDKNYYDSSNYDYKNGTSMAAPYVTGTIGLIQEAMPYMTSKQALDSLFTTCDKDFLKESYVVTVSEEYKEINLTYINRAAPSDAQKRADLEKAYDNNSGIRSKLKAIGVNRDNLYSKFIEIGSTKDWVSKERVIGYGLVDAGRAVQGPAALDASRLSSADLSTMYNAQKKNEYIYSVNTGKASDNYQRRKYSIWSNNIEQWNDVNSCNVGLLKTGEVDLYLLGDNTYKGPTVVNGGKLQIVKGVEGDVFANGLNGYAEAVVNGKAGAVYAMPNSGVKITDTIVKGRDFLSEALPKTTQVAINGGLFSAGMENNLSVINVELSNPKSTITGPLYQNAFGQVNVRLDSGATYNIQQGSGYYNTNTFVGNNCMNWLTLFGGNVSLKDNKYSALAVNYLSGYNGVFALDSDLKNGIGDKLIINATPLGLNSGPHYLNVYDKSGYIDTSSGRALLLAVAPNVVDLSGLNVDYGTYKYTPQFLNKTSGDNKKWYFIGYSNNGTTYTGPLYKGEFTYLENAGVTNSGMFTDGLYYNTGAGNMKLDVFPLIYSKERNAFFINADVLSNASDYDKLIINGEGYNNIIEGVNGKITTNSSVEVNLTYDGTKYYDVKGINAIQTNKEVSLNLNTKSGAKSIKGIALDNEAFNAKEGTTVNIQDEQSSNICGLEAKGISDFKGDLDINISSNGNSVGILTNDNTHIHNNVNINAISYDEKNEAATSFVGLENNGSVTIDGNFNFYANNNNDNSSYRYLERYGIKNSGIVTINGDVDIAIKDCKDDWGECIDNSGKIIIKGDIHIKKDLPDGVGNYIAYGTDGNDTLLKANRLECSEYADIYANSLEIEKDLRCYGLSVRNGKGYINGECNVKNVTVTNAKYTFKTVNSDGEMWIKNGSNVIADSIVIKHGEYPEYNYQVDCVVSVTDSSLKVNNLETAVLKSSANGDILINPDKTGTVRIHKGIEIDGNAITNNQYSINFTNSNSFLKGKINCVKGMYFYGDYPMSMEFSNGATWFADEKIFGKNLNLALSNKGALFLNHYNDNTLKSLTGNEGIINFSISKWNSRISDGVEKCNISIPKLTILNETQPEASKHYITFMPDKYNGFSISEGAVFSPVEFLNYGTYGKPSEHFEVLPFDAGAYKYSPVVEFGEHSISLTKVVPYGSSLSVVNKANETDQQYDYSGENRVVTTINKVENSTVTGGNALNIVSVKGGSNNQIAGGGKSDIFRVKGSEQLVSGGAGDDIITIKGGNANIVNGGAGNDRYAFSSLSARGEYLVDQSTAGAKDRDSVSLAGYSKNDFTFSRNYEGDLVITQKGEDGATIYVKGWNEHALNNIAFADGQMKAAELTALAGEIPEEPKDLWNTLTAAGEDSLSEEKNASDKQVISQGDPVLSNLAHNVHKTAINNAVNFRNEYNNLRKRLGDLHLSKEEEGIWARNFHGRQESSKYGFSGSHNGFQLGFDRSVTREDGDKWLYGVAATSYQGKNSLTSGKLENKSVGGAVYGTYLGGKGHYLDLVARHSRQNNELTSIAEGSGQRLTGEYHNWGTSVSAEYGRRIDLKKGLYLQPEAELIYGHVNKASYTLSDNSRVKQSGLDGITGRIGLSLGKSTRKGGFAVSANYVHDFGDTTSSTISDKYGKSNTQKHNTKDSWLELDLGGNVKLGNNTYLYGDMEKSFGGDIKTKWRYNLGVRCSF